VLVLAEGSGLTQKLVNQCGFAMIDVGDDGDISECATHARLAKKDAPEAVSEGFRWFRGKFLDGRIAASHNALGNLTLYQRTSASQRQFRAELPQSNGHGPGEPVPKGAGP
jgi:hypothetical protein